MGVSRNTIYRWRDNKQQKFEDDNLLSIADTLDISYEWIKYGKEDKADISQERAMESLRILADSVEDDKELYQSLESLELKLENLLKQIRRMKKDLDRLDLPYSDLLNALEDDD